MKEEDGSFWDERMMNEYFLQDEWMARQALVKQPWIYERLSRWMQRKRSVAKVLINNHPDYLQKVPQMLRLNPQFLEELIDQNPQNWRLYEEMDEEMWHNKRFLLRILKLERRVFEFVAKSLRQQTSFVNKAVQVQGEVLDYLSKEEQTESRVLDALRQNGNALQYLKIAQTKSIAVQAVRDIENWKLIDKKFWMDHNVCLSALKTHVIAMSLIDKSLKNDRSFIAKAVQVKGEIFKKLQTEFRNDLEIASLAMKNGGNPRYLGEDLRLNKDVIMEAVKKNPYALRHVHRKLRNDLDIIEASCSREVKVYNFVSDFMKNHPRVIIAALKGRNLHVWRKITPDMLQDRQFILKAVQAHGKIYSMLPKELQEDKEIVLATVQQNGLMLEHMAAEFRADPEIVHEALLQDGGALAFASSELQKDRDLVLLAVHQNGSALQYANAKLRADKKMVMECVKKRGCSLRFASKELRDDWEVVQAAVKNHSYAWMFASETLQRGTAWRT